MSDLRKSSEPLDTEKALQRVDEYLGKVEGQSRDRVVHNRTIINTGGATGGQNAESENTGNWQRESK